MAIFPCPRQTSPTKQRSDIQLFKSNKDKHGNPLIRMNKVPPAVLALIAVGVFCLFGFSQEAVVLSEATADFKERFPHQREEDNEGGGASLLYRPNAKKQPRDKLSLEQWQEVQKSTVIMQEQSRMECEALGQSSTGGGNTSRMALMVWAYDGPPDGKRFKESIASLPKDTKVQLFCGSTLCMERANRIRMSEHNPCLQIDRLNAIELASGTPLAAWTNQHVLAKLLSGHHYEHHLQVAMQLAALWKFGGILLQPGVKYDNETQLDVGDFLGTCKSSIANNSPNLGGLWGLSASSQSPWVNSMIENFLSVYGWDKPIRDRYQPGNWPIALNTEDLAPSSLSANRIPLGSACPLRGFQDGYGGPPKYYGTLNYDERRKFLVEVLHNPAMNLGDETQGLAGIQALPRLDAFVERDRLEIVKFIDKSTPPLVAPNASYPDDGRRVQLFFNAWWGTPTMTWPPPKYVEPITISMHFQPIRAIYNKVKELPETILPETPSWVKRIVYRLIGKKEKVVSNKPRPLASYLRSQAPIGARDTKTLKFLRDSGVQALFSACLTMTLSIPKLETDNSVLVVDVDAEEHLKGRIPDSVLEQSVFLTQKLYDEEAEDKMLRFVLAYDRLLAYSRARLVITNRLHVAMPCVALGTPVIFVHHKELPGGGGNRMDGLDVFMHQMREGKGGALEDFDWENPPPNPKAVDFKTQVKRIQHLATCHTGIADSSRKFGVGSSAWVAGEEDEVCTRESAWSANPDAIHIATTLDANFFELVFPSWVNALAKSNPNEPLVIYVLTIKLSEKQRCLLRLMVLKLLPNAKIFTIPTNVAKFEKAYSSRKRGHISIATQSRLLLPSILPCVRKLLWIDLDAFVIGPIRPAWELATGTCGITARSSLVNYMGHYKKYHPTLETWHEDYGKSFNAGVMVVDLQKLREASFEEKVVKYWAATLGANDQVTFNVACNATHGELPARMNVFQGVPDKSTPERSEWIIAHFQSSKKPWSDSWDEAWSSKDFWQIWEDNKMTFEEVLDI